MSFFDPYTAGDPNPDELNPHFVHYCIAGVLACVAAWLLLDNLMLRLVLAGVIIGLVTAISGRGVQQVDSDDPGASARASANRQPHAAPLRNQPLVAMPSAVFAEHRRTTRRAEQDPGTGRGDVAAGENT